MDIKNRFAIAAGVCALASFSQNASAENSYSDDFQKLTKLVVQSIENDRQQKGYDLAKSSAPDDTSEVGNSSFNDKNSYKPAEDDFAERLIKKIPYNKSLKYMWNVADGDVDIYFEDLRMDLGNKGVTYKIKSLPMIGKMNASELNADLGENTKLTFKSDYVPLVGRVEGLQFQTTAGTDNSSVSLRYKMDISW